MILDPQGFSFPGNSNFALSLVVANVRQRRVIQDASRSIPDRQENAKERTVLFVQLNMATQSFGILEGRQRAVDRTDDFSKKYLRRRPLEAIAAFGAALALDNPGVLEFK